MAINFFSDINSIEGTDRYVQNLIVSKADMLEIIVEFLLDDRKLLRVPVNQVHLIHSHDDLVHSQ